MTTDIRPSNELSIEESREKLLEAIRPLEDVTFICGYGNVGDDLIHAGTRQLLSGIQYREHSILKLAKVSGGAALLSGCGGWCGAFHAMPQYLRDVESRFEQVIVLPSSFDVSVKEVRETLSRTKAKVFAREAESYAQIRDLCDADLAHDAALYFDYRPYRREGRGSLTAYRTDHESARARIPLNNDDISVTCDTLDQFLWTIARHEWVRTDRAHVTIAAAKLGKRVEYSASNYHKVPAIVSFSLRGLPVVRIDEPADSCDSDASTAVEPCEAALPDTYRNSRQAHRRVHLAWLDSLQRAREEIASLVPPDVRFIFVDDNQWGREPVAQDRRPIPFLEKDGGYWGAPEDDDVAIAELERLRQDGADFLIFAWPAFWWLEHYRAFSAHVRSNYRQVWSGARLVAFDLRMSLRSNP